MLFQVEGCFSEEVILSRVMYKNKTEDASHAFSQAVYIPDRGKNKSKDSKDEYDWIKYGKTLAGPDEW